MKITLSLITTLFFITNLIAQSQTISKDEYERVFQFAVRETNADYPHIFKVVTNTIENDKTISTTTEINENESPGHYRIKRTVLAEGKETTSYQITFGFGNVFCSKDGVSWKSSKYECDGERIIFGRREPESVEYSITENTLNGKKVKVYREYSIFASSDGNKTFKEKSSIIDSRGFFLTVVDIEGTLSPKLITFKREQSWVIKAKFKPVVAPTK